MLYGNAAVDFAQGTCDVFLRPLFGHALEDDAPETFFVSHVVVFHEMDDIALNSVDAPGASWKATAPVQLVASLLVFLVAKAAVEKVHSLSLLDKLRWRILVIHSGTLFEVVRNNRDTWHEQAPHHLYPPVSTESKGKTLLTPFISIIKRKLIAVNLATV
jgi:hypothetical protein